MERRSSGVRRPGTPDRVLFEGWQDFLLFNRRLILYSFRVVICIHKRMNISVRPFTNVSEAISVADVLGLEVKSQE